MSEINYIHLTLQEIALCLGTFPEQDQDQPHKPIAVQNQSMDIAECNRIRQGAKTTECYAGFWGNSYKGKMSLEELDEKGETIQDPRLVEVLDGRQRALGIDFPFPRDGPIIDIGRT
jgi:hypothetical protein